MFYILQLNFTYFEIIFLSHNVLLYFATEAYNTQGVSPDITILIYATIVVHSEKCLT